MKRIALGAVAGLAAWFGSALAAEAQQITPTGPMNIYTGTSSTNYTANATIPYLQSFSVQVWVYRGNNPTPICSGEIFVNNPTTLDNPISFAASWSPGAITGEKFKFKSTLVFNYASFPATDLVITVKRPTTYVEPSKSYDHAFAAIDRDRRHEA